MLCCVVLYCCCGARVRVYVHVVVAVFVVDVVLWLWCAYCAVQRSAAVPLCLVCLGSALSNIAAKASCKDHTFKET